MSTNKPEPVAPQDLESALSNLAAAAQFWRQVHADSKDHDTSSTGAFKDAREWLTDAALAVADARAAVAA